MKYSTSLKKNRDFQYIYRKGTSKANRLLVMYILNNDTRITTKDVNAIKSCIELKIKPERINRFGISVSKKVGNSVVRHHITRLLREAYRLNEETVHAGYDIVIIARTGAKEASYHEVESALLHLFKLHKLNSK